MTGGFVWPTHIRFELEFTDASKETYVATRQASHATFDVYDDPAGDDTGNRYRFCRNSGDDSQWVFQTQNNYMGTYWIDVATYTDQLPWEGSVRCPAGTPASIEDIRILDSWTDWGRLDVVWIPMLYGFLTGLILDLILSLIAWMVRHTIFPIYHSWSTF